jgi:hypothetical protein
MKITEDVRKYAAEHGLTDAEAVESGMQEKRKNSSKRVGKFMSAASTRSFVEQNGANGMSDIEGKAARVAASERGKRTSFKATEFTKSGSEIYART